MKPLLSSVLMASLFDIVSWRLYSVCAYEMTQSPDQSVTEGDTVTITCCAVGANRLSYIWMKTNNTNIIQTGTAIANSSQECSTLNLSNITKNDSGRYICKIKIELPSFYECTGNGTVITVATREKKGGQSDGKFHVIISAVATAVLLLLVALCCFCFMRLKRAQAARVIYEVPHLDSEEAEMEKHSTTSSRGSTQWCQVPMYESLDYFEHVQNKESE